MLRRFNLCRRGLLYGLTALGLLAILGLTGTQQAGAAVIGPGQLERAAKVQILSPVHCKKRRHMHKRCRYCRPEYHTCRKKK